jgi:probable O-glycosylation ligase (exosortase A-associated)
MNKLILMLVLTAVGVGGSLALSPFYGVAIYYLYAVLRPQFIWDWALPPNISWSYYVALASIFSVIVWKVSAALMPHQSGEFRSPALNVGHWAMLFFAFWITVTYYTAINLPIAKPFYEEYQKIFIMFFVAALAVTNVRQVWVLFLILTLSLAYIAVDVNQTYFTYRYLLIYQRGYAGLDNNGAGLMLAMGVPLCMFAWDGIKHWSRWGFLLVVPLLIHAVMTSYSRGAMLALIVSIPIYLIRCRHKKQLTLVLLGFALLTPVLAGKEIQERFFSIDKHEEDASAQSRLTTWGIAWDMACERPIFGFGVRNSPLFTKEYGADMEGRAIHSQFLQIAADSGMVGMAAYFFVIAAFAYCLWRVRRARKGHRGIVWGLLTFGAYCGLWKYIRPPDRGRDDPEIERAYTIANGIEGALLVFCIGGIFLSLETFELPYILFLMAAQLWALVRLAKAAPVVAVHPVSIAVLAAPPRATA